MVPDVPDVGVDIIALVLDVRNLGVDVGVLVLDVRDLGVDIGYLVADVLVLGVDRKSSLLIEWRRRAGNARCLTMEDALERVSAAVCLEALRATGGVERRIVGGFGEVNQGRAWVVEEPYDVASEDIRGLLDFTKPPRTIKGMVPNGGSDRRRSGQKASAVDVVSDKSVRTREVAFAVGAGDFAHGCVNSQLLVLPGVGLVMVCTIHPIGKNECRKA